MAAKIIVLNLSKDNHINYMNWYCYILKCRDGSYYTGVTKDLDKRIEKHNQGKGAKYTAMKRPVVLVWSKKFPSKIAALKKENEIKEWKRDKKEELVHKVLLK